MANLTIPRALLAGAMLYLVASDLGCAALLPGTGTPAPEFEGCPTGECGLNSPVVNAFPYGALHPDGLENTYHVSLVPNSLKKDYSACNQGASALNLDFAPRATPESGYELVARASDGTIQCRGAALVGATFDVKSPNRTTTLRISQVAAVTVGTSVTITPTTGPGAAASVQRLIYLVTPRDYPMNSVCTSRGPGSATPMPVLLNTMSDQVPVMASEELASYAVIIPGAVYDSHAALVPNSTAAATPAATSPTRNSSHRWFNIACASDGLAATELTGISAVPITDEPTARLRLPSLHMFTAKYCAGVSATARGTPIGWNYETASARWEFKHPREQTSQGQLIVEARWGSDGATCLSHSRLWMFDKTIPLPDTLSGLQGMSFPTETHFLNTLCPQLTPCGAAPPAAAGSQSTLTSYAIDHVSHTPSASPAATPGRGPSDSSGATSSTTTATSFARDPAHVR